MKRFISAILAFVMLFTVATNVSAVSDRVYSEPVVCEKGDRITIPIKIEGNSGFMGFAVIVSYDKDIFTPVSVSKGEMLKGIFNDSISTSSDNTFKAVFTGTENFTDDCILFNMVFDVADNVSGKYDISLSYSQPDTFKEGWADVNFNCEPISVSVSYVEPETELTTVQPEEPTEEPEEETTEAPTQPQDTPDVSQKLSERIRAWANGLPVPLNIILVIFALPFAWIVSIFE
ncbi:MAG: hypothetical protein IKB55_02040 [Clostridia bacterium]|nr:hypothetical protein [Clostridia bacterium]